MCGPQGAKFLVGSLVVIHNIRQRTPRGASPQRGFPGVGSPGCSKRQHLPSFSEAVDSTEEEQHEEDDAGRDAAGDDGRAPALQGACSAPEGENTRHQGDRPDTRGRSRGRTDLGSGCLALDSGTRTNRPGPGTMTFGTRIRNCGDLLGSLVSRGWGQNLRKHPVSPARS